MWRPSILQLAHSRARNQSGRDRIQVVNRTRVRCPHTSTLPLEERDSQGYIPAWEMPGRERREGEAELIWGWSLEGWGLLGATPSPQVNIDMGR